MLLLAAAGHSDSAIAVALGTSRQRVGRWRHRWLSARALDDVDTLADAPRSGRPRAHDVRILLATGAADIPGRVTATAVARHLRLAPASVRATWRRWGVTAGGPTPTSTAVVLPTEVVGLAGLHLSPPDLAFAYWTRHAPRRPAPGHHRPQTEIESSLFTRLAALTGIDRCFPRLGDAEFDEFVRSLHHDGEDAGLRIVVGNREMLDDDVTEEWRRVPGVWVIAPHATVTWLEHLAATAAAAGHPEHVVTRLVTAVGTVLASRADHDTISWLFPSTRLSQNLLSPLLP